MDVPLRTIWLSLSVGLVASFTLPSASAPPAPLPVVATAAQHKCLHHRYLPPSLSLLDTFKSSIERLTDLRVARASHILLKGFDAETVARMEEIKKEINNDAELFAAKATELSLCPSRAKGGDLGFFTRGKVRHPHVLAAPHARSPCMCPTDASCAC